jgi:hypothetical protein
MTAGHVCALLGIFGGTLIVAAWVGGRVGDSRRDRALMLGMGIGFSGLAGVVYAIE